MRRWLARFGPGTEADLRWWSGLTARAIRAALARVGAERSRSRPAGSTRGYVLPGDVEPDPARPIRGWPCSRPSTRRRWAGATAPGTSAAIGAALFDTVGNAGPTIWVDGRIVGGWAIRDGGEVVTALLEDVGGDAELAIEAEAARLSAQLSSVRVFPRFPTPLHGTLAG